MKNSVRLRRKGRLDRRAAEQLHSVETNGAIKNTDRTGFELDSELLSYVLDRFLALCKGNGGVILVSRELALGEDAVSFTGRKVP